MILQALLAAAAFGWLYRRGYIGSRALRRLALLAALGLSVWLLAKGQRLIGGALAALVAALYLGKQLPSRLPRRRPGAGKAEREASTLLGLGREATREEILAAHRRRIAEVHPDRHGSGDDGMASRVNAARDLLLSRLPPAL